MNKDTYILRLVRYYGALFKKQFGFNPTINIPRFGKAMKQLVETHTEDQIKALMIVFFNWYGMDGKDQFEHDKLMKATFNPQWFLSCINSYEAYLRNVLEINIDNAPILDKFLKDNI